jgi:hypothetical protein
MRECVNAELKHIEQFFTERRLRCLSVTAIEIDAKQTNKIKLIFIKKKAPSQRPLIYHFQFCIFN